MELVKFAVHNYRSIKTPFTLQLSDLTVLVGPNNVGKSNILRALHTGLGVLVDMPERLSYAKFDGKSSVFLAAAYGVLSRRYTWVDDFPVSLQHTKKDGHTELLYEFKLTAAEQAEFQKKIGSETNGTLPIQLLLSAKGIALRVKKPGRGNAALTKKVAKIAEFVGANLDYEYVPAVRTAEAAERVVEQMVQRSLAPLEKSPQYAEVLSKIAELQQPMLDELSETVKRMLASFLPNVKDVRIGVTDRDRANALRKACQIIVDDGNPTDLKQKGDGVQSLAALAVLKNASESTAEGRRLVLAIEEPESHLHPKAIHELRSVLLSLAGTHQIILTTHCPLLVRRDRLRSNVVVSSEKATAATSVEEIRKVLGVRAADNLQNAELVLVVEGEDDAVAVRALLENHSVTIRDAFSTNTIAIESLAGANNLAYKLSMLRSALCQYHVWVDNDSTARLSVQRATDEGLLLPVELHQATVIGMFESEFEDLLKTDLYENFLLTTYGVSTFHPAFNKHQCKKKWKDRMRTLFVENGKGWDDSTEQNVKRSIAKLVRQNPSTALEGARSTCFVAFANAIDQRIKSFK
jgi:putative ATP-dependent endonuclease of the OLD family